MKKKKIFILHHLGLGDAIICNGIYRNVAKQNDLVVFAVKKRNFESVKQMIFDVKNIKIIKVSNKHGDRLQVALSNVIIIFGFNVLKLGIFGDKTIHDQLNMNFDEIFYKQANVNFDERWKSSIIPRNTNREIKLYKKLNPNERNYIFIHDDPRRLFEIANIPTTKKIIRPLTDIHNFTIFDYSKILEEADELHMMESSFAALLESLNPQGKKFKYLNIRPEFKQNHKNKPNSRIDWIEVV